MRRFNYTGRRKLNRADVSIVVSSTDGHVEFDFNINFSNLQSRGVPASAQVFVEAYNSRTKLERFHVGTVARPELVRRRLESFHADERVLFRVRVVAPDGSGRILAMADALRPSDPDTAPRRSLLPVSIEPLDDVIFVVDFPEDGSRPRLILNQDLDSRMAQGVKAIARTPLFVSLVYPEVLRQILTRLFVIDRRDPSDAGEERGWVESWYNLASALNPDPMPALDREDVEARLGWIDAAVSRFARNSGALDRFERGWSQ